MAVRLAATAVIVERAIERGDISADNDAAEIIRHVVAPVYYRALICHEVISDDVLRTAVSATMAAIRAACFAA